MRPLGDHHALCRVGVVFAHEGIAAGIERPQPDAAFAAAGNHLLDLERGGIELLHAAVFILDGQNRGLSGRNMDLGRRELMVLDGDGDPGFRRGKVGAGECRRHQKKRCRDEARQGHWRTAPVAIRGRTARHNDGPARTLARNECFSQK